MVQEFAVKLSKRLIQRRLLCKLLFDEGTLLLEVVAEFDSYQQEVRGLYDEVAHCAVAKEENDK